MTEEQYKELIENMDENVDRLKRIENQTAVTLGMLFSVLVVFVIYSVFIQ